MHAFIGKTYSLIIFKQTYFGKTVNARNSIDIFLSVINIYLSYNVGFKIFVPKENYNIIYYSRRKY